MPDQIEGDIAAIGRIDAVASILEVVCRTTGMGFAAVARVTEDRWVACAVRDDIAFGLTPGGELRLETTICNEIRASGKAVVIDDVAQDEVFKTHHTPALYGFQSYISMPIVQADQRFFGTLCAIDPRPARVSDPAIVQMFKLFAELIAFHLDAQERVAVSEAALLSERQVAELREQFLAVLGHDLRNPLSAIGGGLGLLRKEAPTKKASLLLDMMGASARRMAELVDNLLDLARGRLGGGVPVVRHSTDALGLALQQVVEEIRLASSRRIDANIAVEGDVVCDRSRIAQLLSNLISNALTHGAPDQPVRVATEVHGGMLEISVANLGEPIAAATLGRLFQPFFRGAATNKSEGLGLGLYIAAEIARSHGGDLDLTSTPEETRFSFRMPIA